MSDFAQRLAGLPTCDHLYALVLTGPQGQVERIDNRPGSQGSLRIYAHLAQRHGAITPAAAREGLALYGEHVQDAQLHPGKHPNIDRLLRLVGADDVWRAEIQPA